ncbi:MAG: ribbon-helix-helix domain-containing protein [Fervidobacterium sp.]
MKTLRISDETHRRLTAALGMLMAETGRLQTYDSTITALLTRSVKVPKETVMEVENFINENKHRGYVTKEEFIKEAIRFKLETLKGEKEYIEIPKEKYEN